MHRLHGDDASMIDNGAGTHIADWLRQCRHIHISILMLITARAPQHRHGNRLRIDSVQA